MLRHPSFNQLRELNNRIWWHRYNIYNCKINYKNSLLLFHEILHSNMKYKYKCIRIKEINSQINNLQIEIKISKDSIELLKNWIINNFTQF